MKKLFTILTLLFSVATFNAFSINNTYFVKLTDKRLTEYSIESPEDFLSAKAIARRVRLNIDIDSIDLPVAKFYIDSIKSYGAKVLHPLKWHNGLIVESNAETMQKIKQLKFVEYSELTHSNTNNISTYRKTKRRKLHNKPFSISQDQKAQIGVDALHNMGFRGQGVTIAVIDAGYKDANRMSAFDSLRNNGHLLGTHDFANQQSNIYNEHIHGTLVLSTMAANQPSSMIGTAPEADYWLLRSEIDEIESPLEIDLFCRAVEWADSAGVDLITTSLGYSQFDNSSLNYSYIDMDGITIRSSISATYAVQRGIFTVVSAGNEGSKEWHHITSPADANGVLSVGAVDSIGNFAPFSSYGPSYDGRVKPEVCARGYRASVVNTDNNVMNANGTSFACPIITGMVASLMSALPELDPNTLYDNICATASIANNPNDSMGYGIPNALQIYQLLTNTQNVDFSNSIKLSQDSNSIRIHNLIHSSSIEIINMQGKIIYSAESVENNEQISTESLERGIYLVRIGNQEHSSVIKFIK